MSNILDAQSALARRADAAAMDAARSKVVERAREHVLPRPRLPANDRDPIAI